jgi:hypothetical protein
MQVVSSIRAASDISDIRKELEKVKESIEARRQQSELKDAEMGNYIYSLTA